MVINVSPQLQAMEIQQEKDVGRRVENKDTAMTDVTQTWVVQFLEFSPRYVGLFSKVCEV